MKKILFTMLALVLSLGMAANISEAAKKKDRKKPTVKLTLVNMNWTRKSVQVNVSAKDKSGIKTLVWKPGKIKKSKASKWYGAKNIKKKKYFKAPANGWYSVKAVDKRGNAKIQNIKVSTIDKQGPDGNVTYTVNNKVATITVSANDPRGVASVKWAEGYINNPSASKFPNTVQNNVFTGTQNGYYTVRLQDTLGNVSLKMVYVTISTGIEKMTVINYNDNFRLASSVKNNLKNRTYFNAYVIFNPGFGSETQEYVLDGKYKFIEGTVDIRYLYTEDPSTVLWLCIYADDNLIFKSNGINYKGSPQNFKVDIRNARILKIEVNGNNSYCYYSRSK